jgi:hypothetical protein
VDDSLPPLLFRPALIASGFAESELQRGRRAGELAVVRRGAYVSGDDQRLADPVRRHALSVAAEVRRVAPSAVVSHVSAAVLYGLPVWRVPLERVHVTRARPTGARAGRSVAVHSAPLAPEEIVRVGDVWATCPARTAVDLARTVPFEASVVTIDAALRHGLVTAETLAVALRRATGWRGVPAARRAVAFADGGAESVGESRGRVALLRAGLPAPTLQWEIWHGGKLIGRVDFAWPDRRTVAEFDGKIKYGRLLRPGQQPGDAVFEEKIREDRLRAAGLHVVRWTWADLDTFAPTAARLRAALAAS